MKELESEKQKKRDKESLDKKADGKQGLRS
jgi:hypothetical protein